MTSQHTDAAADRPDYAHDDSGGLYRDLPALVGRRRALAWIGGAGLAGLLAACGSGNDAGQSTTASTSSGTDAATTATGTADATTTTTTTTAATDVVNSTETSAGEEIPDETAGPYPADGSNGPNFLSEDGIVRQDLTSSVGSMSGSADGVPTTIQLTVVDAETGSALPGAAVYLWHCTATGQYSIYEIEDQNYLRGVQVADDNGLVTFTTIFPGCYAGRWPHCHFEVYDGVDLVTTGSQAAKTSQLALSEAACNDVYTDSRYGSSAQSLGQLSLSSDNVFSDGWESQLATTSGSVDDGYTVSLLVRV